MIKGWRMPLCSRCFGLYFGLVLSFIFSITFNIARLFNKNQLLLVAFVLCSPLAIDGITQLFKLRESSNSMRLVTGLMSGIFCGVGLHYIIIHYF